ncbi:hypothetical protein [Escherichia coli]|uniref:hypothetical protein n=1 Tax=Escherichia coli TaxID=562 RepID=UPI001EEB9AE2|nr:hypothetical protein [Escherichia coli]
MANINCLLAPLCDAIRNETLKSKQTIFNIYIHEILEAKKMHSWRQICEHINKHANTNINVDVCRNMLVRAKKNTTDSVKSPLTKVVERPSSKAGSKVGSSIQKAEERQERDQLGRLIYPKKEFTEEALLEWEDINIPRSSKVLLIRYGVTKDEYRGLQINIMDPSIINDKVREYCKKKESEWDRTHNSHMYRIKQE